MRSVPVIVIVGLLLSAAAYAAPASRGVNGGNATAATPRTFKPNLPSTGLKAAPGPGGIVTAPGRVTPGTNCVSVCGSHCSSLSCGNLNVSQCTRARQQCRVTCRSRC